MSGPIESFASRRFTYFYLAVGMLFIALSVATWTTDKGTQLHSVIANAREVLLWAFMLTSYAVMALSAKK